MYKDITTFCLLFDDNDLFDFKGKYKDRLPKSFSWFPVNSGPISQILLTETKEGNYIPTLKKTENDTFIKHAYHKSKEFLKDLCYDNDIDPIPSEILPLEYFWWRTWIGVYRTIAYCNNLLNNCSVKEIIIIDRNKYVIEGGLLRNNKSYIGLIRHFFESKGIIVKCFNQSNSPPKPNTIFYDQKFNLIRSLIHLVRFFRWKVMSFDKKNYRYILIKPSYDNIINYKRDYLYSSDRSCPQAYHGGNFPFLHSVLSLFRYWITKRKLYANQQESKKPIIGSFMDTSCGFDFDFNEYFHETILRFIKDVKWMDNYINMFWDICFKKHQPVLINFGITPCHLDSFFLIKKIKSFGGKVATRQHGGYYSYTKQFMWPIALDYTCADYFLSFGESDINDIKLIGGFPKKPIPVEIGSNVVVRQRKNRNKIKGSNKSNGIYIPPVVNNFTMLSIDKASQFGETKMIIDSLASFNNIETEIKGLGRHKFHEELYIYIKRKSFMNLSYTSVSLNKALSKQPRFVILDCSSTPLLQVLASYSGPIFLLLSQPPLVKKEALKLLKRRVMISKSVDELKSQLKLFTEIGKLKEVNLMDNAFNDVYCKPFNYSIYEKFINEAIKAY